MTYGPGSPSGWPPPDDSGTKRRRGARPYEDEEPSGRHALPESSRRSRRDAQDGRGAADRTGSWAAPTGEEAWADSSGDIRRDRPAPPPEPAPERPGRRSRHAGDEPVDPPRRAAAEEAPRRRWRRDGAAREVGAEDAPRPGRRYEPAAEQPPAVAPGLDFSSDSPLELDLSEPDRTGGRRRRRGAAGRGSEPGRAAGSDAARTSGPTPDAAAPDVARAPDTGRPSGAGRASDRTGSSRTYGVPAARSGGDTPGERPATPRRRGGRGATEEPSGRLPRTEPPAARAEPPGPPYGPRAVPPGPPYGPPGGPVSGALQASTGRAAGTPVSGAPVSGGPPPRVPASGPAGSRRPVSGGPVYGAAATTGTGMPRVPGHPSAATTGTGMPRVPGRAGAPGTLPGPRPPLGPDRAPYGPDRPPYGPDRPPYGPERPPYGADRPAGVRPAFGAERPPYGPNRPTGAAEAPGTRAARRAHGAGGASRRLHAGQSLGTGWVKVLAIIGLVALLAVCGYGGYLLLADERSGAAGAGSAGLTASDDPNKRDISNQIRDPQPLTEAEVFPTNAIRPDPSQPAYTLVKTQKSANCADAATGGLGAMLVKAGCTQVVRGTLLSPTKAYVLTTGIFNLKDERGATTAHDSIQPLLDARKGRFTGYAAGGATDVIARSATQLGWNYRGHYLTYCVIARADGKPLDAKDQQAGKIIDDMVRLYLSETVIEHRVSLTGPSVTPS